MKAKVKMKNKIKANECVRSKTIALTSGRLETESLGVAVVMLVSW
jgi:hypothetical protein